MTSQFGRSRRSVLGLGLGVAGGTLLAACSGTSQSPSGPRASGPVKLPNYTPRKSFPGAIISGQEGVPPAYEKYPNPPFTSVDKVPGRGGEVSSFHVLFTPPPSNQNNSEVFKAFEKSLGVTLKPTYTPFSGYQSKLATILAGGDIPDITWVNTEVVPAAVRYFQQGAFADLTDVLAGDGVTKYPNLAQLPTYAWKNCTVENVLYGVPRPIPLLNNSVGLYRADWARKLGFSEAPKDSAEYLEMMTAFSKGDPRGGTNSWGAALLDVSFVRQMFRVPNEWRLNDDGTLTYYLETDEYEEALKFHISEWKAGVYHPNATAGGDNYSKSVEFFDSGQTGLYLGSLNAHFAMRRPKTMATNPGADPQPLVPPGHDGKNPLTYEQRGYYGIAAIPSKVGNDESKLEELLGILNVWAAPFGTEEYALTNYGLAGRQFNFDNDGQLVPVEADKLPSEAVVPYLCQTREAQFYFPGNEEDGRLGQAALEKAMKYSAPNPTTGLVSDAAVRSSAALSKINGDYEVGIITGRRSLSELTEWRGRWRTAGGDESRKEFQDSLERANK